MLQLVNYSPKALAVIGDTRPVKDDLKTMGGRFNGRLSVEGEKVAGWIFPVAKRQDLEKYVGSGTRSPAARFPAGIRRATAVGRPWKVGDEVLVEQNDGRKTQWYPATVAKINPKYINVKSSVPGVKGKYLPSQLFAREHLSKERRDALHWLLEKGLERDIEANKKATLDNTTMLTWHEIEYQSADNPYYENFELLISDLSVWDYPQKGGFKKLVADFMASHKRAGEIWKLTPSQYIKKYHADWLKTYPDLSKIEKFLQEDENVIHHDIKRLDSYHIGYVNHWADYIKAVKNALADNEPVPEKVKKAFAAYVKENDSTMKNKKDAAGGRPGAIAVLGEQNENVHEVVALIQRFFAMLNQEISVDDVDELVNHFKALGRLPKEYSALANSIRTKLIKVLAIAAQNKFYRINLEVADQKFFTKVADTIAQSSYFDTKGFNSTTQCYALNYPVSKLHTDTKRFQNRKDAFSEVSARQVAENFDVNKFDPIVVWQDAQAKKVFILSGHSRYEGLKRRKAKTVPVRFFEGTEAEAIQFAKVEANRSAEKESLSEDLNAYRLLRDGDKAQNIAAVSREQIKEKFGSRAPSLELFTYLNQSGLFLQALSNDNISEFPHLERNARWVGQLRREYPKISNLMEDNAFNFFYADKQGKNVKIAKDDFTKLVADRLNTMKPEEKLLFTQDGETITEARRLIEDKLKGEGFKRLKEINEILKFLSDRLTTTDRKIKVWTGEEERYIREELSEKLREEKKRIERDLNYLSEQETLFGLAGCIPCALTARRVGAAAVRRIAKSELSKRAKQAAITAAKEVAKEAAEKIMDVAKKEVKKQGRKGKAKLKKKMGLGAAPRTARQSKGLNGVLPPVAELPVRRAAVLTARPTGVPATDVPPVSVPSGGQAVMPRPVPGADALFQTIGTRREDLDEQPMFTLPGNVGRFLGRIEQKNYAVVIRGEKGAGKSTLQFRIMDSLAEWGLDVAYITLEMSPESNLMAEMTAKYIREENKHRIKATDQVKTVSEVDAIAKQFGAVVLDSWSKLQGLSQQDFEDLFKRNPNTLFFIIFQSTTAGTARGGSMSEYDGSAVIQVNKSENGGIAEMEKNRYSDGKDYRYNVHTDQIYFS